MDSSLPVSTGACDDAGVDTQNRIVAMRTIYNFKVLAVYADYLLAARGYSIGKYTLDGELITLLGTLEDKKYGKFAGNKLTRRLMRAEITALYDLKDGALLAIAKKGFFLKGKEEQVFRKVFSTPRGSKPLNLCFAKSGNVYFGEYFQNVEKAEVHVYGSKDGCKTWQVVYTFPAGNINHIHGLFFDPYTDRIWIVTGDRERECIIGWTDDEFGSLHELFRGGQEYRNCQLFFYIDYIVYATDSQYIENEIRRIDRESLKITTLQKLQGSAIKGGQCGEVAYLSTTVEPSEVNRDKYTHVWVSRGGEEWHEVFMAEKDCYPSILQYATIEFPQHYVVNDCLYFSGRSVRGLDGKTTFEKI